MGTHLADADGVEEPHWKLSQVSLQYDTADVTDNDNFGMALEAARQVVLVRTNHTPESYDFCGVHSGKWQRAVDYVTLANRWQIPLHKAKKHSATDYAARRVYGLASEFVKTFSYKQPDASLSEDAL
jgi:hypothetical protein